MIIKRVTRVVCAVVTAAGLLLAGMRRRGQRGQHRDRGQRWEPGGVHDVFRAPVQRGRQFRQQRLGGACTPIRR